MSLANLTLQGNDRYGAIELHQNADRFVVRGFITTLSLASCSLLAYHAFSESDVTEQRIPVIRSLAELVAPPSIKQDVIESVQLLAPVVDPVKPSLGLYVPVPDAIAPEPIMPNLNGTTAPVVASMIGGIGTPGHTVISVPLKPRVQPIIDEDDPEVFKSVDKDPEPINNLQSLVVYPEVAKRSGLEGKVIISALIDVDGTVIRTRIEMADYEIFKQAAIDAISKVRFTPALQGDEAVRLWYTVPISFKLTSQ